jgi:mRNA-degrading endonuclease toxin of MazEF toxin-antitoxin module
MKRGEVYIAELVPRSGSEQTGRRPVIIVSHDGFNQTPNWRSIIVVPISTSNNQAKRSLTTILIKQNEVGLTQNSIA